ncbi:MAG: DUF5691 domain-containing protein [Blastocatellia bacterium]
MDIWSRLVRRATLGAARDSAEGFDWPDGAAGELATLDADGVESDPGRRLLRRAAAVALERRAGYLPLTVGESLSEGLAAPQRPEARRRCGRKATGLLEEILDGGERFLPEWLSLMDEAELRLPEESLPRMLELGVRRSALRSLIAPVLGGRGEWLAALNPRWKWVLAAPAASDAGPSGATGWREDSNLAGLAASLLTCQPRPFERDIIIVRNLAGRGLNREELELLRSVVAPRRGRLVEADTELPEGTSAGEVAGLLEKIDPRFWEHHLGGSPERLVRMAARSEARQMLLEAWTKSAEAFRAIDWIDALIAERLQEPTEEGLDVFRLLSQERQEFWLQRALRQSRSLEVDQPSFWLLTRGEGVWGERLADQLWPMMIREIEQRSVRVIWDWQAVTRAAARRFDPQLAGAAADYFAATVRLDSPLVPDLVRFITDLGFRARMMSAIRR